MDKLKFFTDGEYLTNQFAEELAKQTVRAMVIAHANAQA
ncbi:hypothetical protein B4110_3632 [Parageobacillus toebii]|jgi:hypothetical protein|uniref:Uncharacterized protein n=1 Tax=Parageobacillus toebii TaxID=153151 RepID=A0A150N770_9BACL|nr:hypothetical protein B4110_3632 [Parageobacillus toebii]